MGLHSIAGMVCGKAYRTESERYQNFSIQDRPIKCRHTGRVCACIEWKQGEGFSQNGKATLCPMFEKQKMKKER